MTVYSKYLPMDTAMRIWDVMFRDGEKFIFEAALGYFKMHQAQLLQVSVCPRSPFVSHRPPFFLLLSQMEFEDLFLFLKAAPDNLPESQLFQCIGAMSVSDKQYEDVLQRATAIPDA